MSRQGMANKQRTYWRRGFSVAIAVFILINAIAALHAWRFTHFTNSTEKRQVNPSRVSIGTKLKIAVTGIPNPRPVSVTRPAYPFQEISLQSNVRLSCWYRNAENAKGTVILFHGYGGEKSGMLDKAYLLLEEGYNVLLPDFMGSGQSEGNTTTIGYREAENVKTCYSYVRSKDSLPVFMLGTSMGAVAIMKCLKDNPDLQPEGIILECPFGTMYETVCARFKMVNAPTFPMAGLLVFWGGIENGFWAYSHNPRDYARSVKCPTLLIFGEKDDRVSMKETNEIFQNLAGPKTLKTYANAGHNDYLLQYKQDWKRDVSDFIKTR